MTATRELHAVSVDLVRFDGVSHWVATPIKEQQWAPISGTEFTGETPQEIGRHLTELLTQLQPVLGERELLWLPHYWPYEAVNIDQAAEYAANRCPFCGYEGLPCNCR